MVVASNAGGASGASWGGHGFIFVWPLGSKFAATMLMQPCGHVYVLGGGWRPRWRQPPRHRSEGLPCIRYYMVSGNELGCKSVRGYAPE